VPLATTGAAPAPRVNAGAVVLKSCDAAGNPCVLLLGGQTPGVAMATSGLGVMVLRALATASPTFAPLWTFPGAQAAVAGVGVNANWAPPGRHSMAVSASPDGTTAFMFGGQLDGGAVTNDFFALNVQGWTNANNVVAAELRQVVSYNGDAGVPGAGIPPNPPTTARNYPCNPNPVNAQCYSYQGGYAGVANTRTCWSNLNAHNQKGAGTPDYYNLPFASGSGRGQPTQLCDSWGSAYCFGSAYNAIDGNTNGDFVGCSVSRSNTDNSPAWYVAATAPVHLRIDLQFTRNNIQQVHLYWRTDCCLSRSGGFQVAIGNDPGPLSATSQVGSGPGGSPTLDANTQLPNPYSDAVLNPTILPASDASGRYVFVLLPGTQRVLGVAEIMVWVRRPNTWRKLNGLVNVALGASVAQSSAMPNYIATLPMPWMASPPPPARPMPTFTRATGWQGGSTCSWTWAQSTPFSPWPTCRAATLRAGALPRAPTPW
jgi:hypothetical protein